MAIAVPQLLASPSTPIAQSLCPELGSDAERELTRQSLVEPLTALLTVPLAFVGPLAWSLGWLVLPILVRAGLRIARA